VRIIREERSSLICLAQFVKEKTLVCLDYDWLDECSLASLDSFVTFPLDPPRTRLPLPPTSNNNTFGFKIGLKQNK